MNPSKKLIYIFFVIFISLLGFICGIYFDYLVSINKLSPVVSSVYKLPFKGRIVTYGKPVSYSGLVPVVDYDPSLKIDLRYATTNNFTGKVVYPKPVCLLQKNTLDKLIECNNDLKKQGYRIKIWDAYRPADVQKYFWSIVKDRRFIADPYLHGSRHNRGCAVDITLVDENGKELEMPTGFDEFSTAAYRNNPNMSATAKKNLDLLTSTMIKHGFKPIETEWWHFDDSEADKYPILNIPLDEIQ
ncbi:M15 family metallopeptidase [Inconstantimicrobium mannanitabidum]|uniref:D-alanyl-D-alanine dipeptidase n=1 Tax=Inconstantimicrobium mannanitabidum TaxID=1604901 RepID=A0ACB5RG44_9CLOT|nr:M15 family metallopeptidase [Clostridium sp. TW13]GKX68059.1 D-alanyl-D-alanine dipeptidase [Clostridium sp. TW13]